jgi:multiple sugar transport system substrate-binding protein
MPRLKRPATTMPSSTTSVWRDGKKQDAAWLLFRFLNTDDYQLPLVQKGLWNPSHTSLLSASGIKRWLDPKVHPEGFERLVTDFMVKYGYADIPAVGVRKATTVLNEGLNQVWNGSAPAADVLKDTVARANKVLDEEQARAGK